MQGSRRLELFLFRNWPSTIPHVGFNRDQMNSRRIRRGINGNNSDFTFCGREDMVAISRLHTLVRGAFELHRLPRRNRSSPVGHTADGIRGYTGSSPVQLELDANAPVVVLSIGAALKSARSRRVALAARVDAFCNERFVQCGAGGFFKIFCWEQTSEARIGSGRFAV